MYMMLRFARGIGIRWIWVKNISEAIYSYGWSSSSFGEHYINTRPNVNRDIFGSVTREILLEWLYQSEAVRIHRCVRIIKLRWSNRSASDLVEKKRRGFSVLEMSPNFQREASVSTPRSKCSPKPRSYSARGSPGRRASRVTGRSQCMRRSISPWRSRSREISPRRSRKREKLVRI